MIVLCFSTTKSWHNTGFGISWLCLHFYLSMISWQIFWGIKFLFHKLLCGTRPFLYSCNQAGKERGWSQEKMTMKARRQVLETFALKYLNFNILCFMNVLCKFIWVKDKRSDNKFFISLSIFDHQFDTIFFLWKLDIVRF